MFIYYFTTIGALRYWLCNRNPRGLTDDKIRPN